MPDPIKLPPGATLVGDNMKLPPGATLVGAAASAPTAEAPPAPAAHKGLLDSLADWGAETYANIPKSVAAKGGSGLESYLPDSVQRMLPPVVHEGIRVLSNAGNKAVRGLTALPAAAVNSVESLADPDSWTPAGHQREQQQEVAQAKANGTSKTLQPGEKLPEPTEENAADLASDELGNGALGLTVGAAANKLLKLPGAVKDFVRGDVDKPIPGMDVTPLQRFNQAKSLGVDLDVADATASPLLGNVKRSGQNSLLGGHLYDAKKAANTGALKNSMDEFLKGMYPNDREAGGGEVLKGLQRDQQGLQGKSEEGFEALPKDIPLPGLEKVGARAQEMGEQNADYQDMFPSLKPSKAMSVVGDVGGLGPQSPPPVKLSPFVDESGAAIPSSDQPAPRPIQSFGTGQKLRSDLLEFTRKNPDIVAGQGDAMVRELSGGVDDALAGGESLLSPSQKKTFRDANEAWRDMKETYDDPSSPYYHAVRTDNPSTLADGVGPKTPENARNLLKRLSPVELPGPTPAVGAVRRGTVESALKPTAEEGPNYKNFPLQLNRIPADYRAELFTLDQNEKLRDLKNTANAIGKDFNPSGSAKEVQKYGEATALGLGLVHPTAAIEPLMQYPLAKFMTSPGAADWMMKPGWKPSPLVAPVVGTAAYEAAKKKKN